MVSVFGFGRSKSHFRAPENAKSAHFQVPENGTSSARIQKRRPLFHANIPPKWWNRHLFYAFTTFGSDSSQFLNLVLVRPFLHCKTDIFGTPLVGGLKIILFQKFFLILFYITKLQYKPPGPIGKLNKSQIKAFKSPP